MPQRTTKTAATTDSGPRVLTARENAAISAQRITVRYPDDETPVRKDGTEHISH